MCRIIERFIEVFRRQREEKLEKDRERIRLMTMDPFDPEAQQKIAEEIRYNSRVCRDLIRSAGISLGLQGSHWAF